MTLSRDHGEVARSARVGWRFLVLLMICSSNVVNARDVNREGEYSELYARSRPNIFFHNVGLLELMVTNIGVIGNPNYVDASGAGWRGGNYLYSAYLTVGAIAPDNLPYVSRSTEWRPSLDPIDTVYPAYEGILGGNRPGFSPRPDDDLDGRMDEEFLNGKDDDGDGLIDEDYAAISQQMYSCEYWDFTQEAQDRFPDHRPLGLKVHQNSYAWSTPGSNEFVGFDFHIVNEGFEVLRQVYLGFFVDADAGSPLVSGYWSDDAGDLLDIDTTFVDPTIAFVCGEDGEVRDCAVEEIELNVLYMYDVPDDGESALGGDVPGFFGGMFLGHTTDPFGERAPESVQMHTARFFNSSAPYPEGDPTTDDEWYDLLQSGDTPRGPVTQPNDYRFFFSAGPFAQMGPGESLDFQSAFVIGDGKMGLIANALNAQRVYNGKWRDVDGNPQTGRNGEEECIRAPSPSEPRFWTNPCDTLNPSIELIKNVDCLPEHYRDNDCNCCTPLFTSANEAATEGRESLVHWVGTVAVPSPMTNLEAKSDPQFYIRPPAQDRSVYLTWDNQSELVADPIQQRILFGGYRIWRVEGWGRPVGSVGPSPEDWQLIADLSTDPADGLGRESPYHLSLHTNEIDSLYRQRTGSKIPEEAMKWYYPVGRYSYTDTLGIKNGMSYFYDITAFSAWTDSSGNYFELGGSPSATEEYAVVPRWDANRSEDLGVYVVPNPYIAGSNPPSWDLRPNDSDPTGTKLAFVGLPADEKAAIKVFTLSGDHVASIDHDPVDGNGTAFWKMVSRNGQEVVSGVYVFRVETPSRSQVGRFAVIR